MERPHVLHISTMVISLACHLSLTASSLIRNLRACQTSKNFPGTLGRGTKFLFSKQLYLITWWPGWRLLSFAVIRKEKVNNHTEVTESLSSIAKCLLILPLVQASARSQFTTQTVHPSFSQLPLIPLFSFLASQGIDGVFLCYFKSGIFYFFLIKSIFVFIYPYWLLNVLILYLALKILFCLHTNIFMLYKFQFWVRYFPFCFSLVLIS